MAKVSTLIQDAMRYPFDGFLSFCPPERRVFQPFHLSLLVQIEEGVHSDECVIFSSLARDVSGPLMTSFLTTLLIEGAYGTSMNGFSVATGQLSVSYFLRPNLELLDAEHFLQLLFNFAELVQWSSPDLLSNAPPLLPMQEDEWLPPQIL